ncbi:MAG TPA: crossover junction endodeoxyribonuclease RuvC, partial [Aggregatilineales bacterium]|nr:crossover junction endodeoxyribonuclease RuvC [Aggregatilineales bacterium]
MLILGIDPGTATTGFGFVREANDGGLTAIDYGVITTKAGVPMPERLMQIYDALSSLIARHQPDEVAIEQLFFGNNVTTGIS